MMHTKCAIVFFWYPLKIKSQVQVFDTRSVIQISEMPDFLKTGRQHMDQKMSDEFYIRQGCFSAGLSDLFAPGRRGYSDVRYFPLNLYPSAYRNEKFSLRFAKVLSL